MGVVVLLVIHKNMIGGLFKVYSVRVMVWLYLDVACLSGVAVL